MYLFWQASSHNQRLLPSRSSCAFPDPPGIGSGDIGAVAGAETKAGLLRGHGMDGGTARDLRAGKSAGSSSRRSAAAGESPHQGRKQDPNPSESKRERSASQIARSLARRCPAPARSWESSPRIVLKPMPFIEQWRVFTCESQVGGGRIAATAAQKTVEGGKPFCIYFHGGRIRQPGYRPYLSLLRRQAGNRPRTA